MLRIDEATFQQATQKTNFNSCATKLQKLSYKTLHKKLCYLLCLQYFAQGYS